MRPGLDEGLAFVREWLKPSFGESPARRQWPKFEAKPTDEAVAPCPKSASPQRNCCRRQKDGGLRPEN